MKYGSNQHFGDDVDEMEATNRHIISPIVTQKDHEPSKFSRLVTLFLVVAVVSASAIAAATNVDVSWFNKATSDLLQRGAATEINTIDSLYAPLYLQSVDSSSFVYRFIQKYGLDGSGGSDSTKVSALDGQKGWVYVTSFPHANCAGIEYSVGGIMTGVCFPIYSESDEDDYSGTSMMFGCEGGDVSMHRYLDTNCETLVWAKNISTDGCTAFNTDLWTDVDTEDKLNGLIQCTSSEDLPLHDDYELYRVYKDNIDSTSEQGFTVFEANPTDVCIPMTWEGKTHSIVFTTNDDDTPHADYYDLKSDCTGIPIKVDLPTELSTMDTNADYPIDFTISSKWVHYIGDPIPTPAPSSVPVLVQGEFSKTNPTAIPTSAPTNLETAEPSIEPTAAKTLHPSLPPVQPSPPTFTEAFLEEIFSESF